MIVGRDSKTISGKENKITLALTEFGAVNLKQSSFARRKRGNSYK